MPFAPLRAALLGLREACSTSDRTFTASGAIHPVDEVIFV
jgi:hypothetical protein